MKRVLLVCGAGMSTSLLVKRIQEADIKHQYIVKCCDTVSAKVELLNNDIFLLAPHIAYLKDEFSILCENNHIPFMVIDTLDYTKMDGKEVIRKIENKLVYYQKENPFHVALLHGRAGAMTDLLLIDMNKKRNEEEKEWIIESVDVEKLIDKQYHVLLLEPQIQFEKQNIYKIMKNPLLVIEVAPMSIYASFDGRKMLDYIQKVYREQIAIKKEIMIKKLEKL